MNNLVACKFAIEDGQVFDGWYNPEHKYWNGWLNPYVNEETHKQITEFMKQGLTEYEPIPEEYEDLKYYMDAEPNNQGLYYWGGCYIWSEV